MKGEWTTLEEGPQATHLGMRKRLVKGRGMKNYPRMKGRPEMGSEEETLAAAEHASSAPKPKWSAKVQRALVAQTPPKG